MRMLVRRCFAVAVAATAFVLVPAGYAAADVVSPPGSCVGSGTWTKGGFTEDSTKHVPSDVIVIPRADTVQWAGNEKGFALGAVGPRRDISGKVQVVLPLIGQATVDKWGGSSVRYANTGRHTYNLPKAVVGIKVKLKGFHKDGGTTTCSGSVFLKVAGKSTSNPLLLGAIGGLVISGGVLLFAGKKVVRKVAPAFEDVNPG